MVFLKKIKLFEEKIVKNSDFLKTTSDFDQLFCVSLFKNEKTVQHVDFDGKFGQFCCIFDDFLVSWISFCQKSSFSVLYCFIFLVFLAITSVFFPVYHTIFLNKLKYITLYVLNTHTPMDYYILNYFLFYTIY